MRFYFFISSCGKFCSVDRATPDVRHDRRVLNAEKRSATQTGGRHLHGVSRLLVSKSLDAERFNKNGVFGLSTLRILIVKVRAHLEADANHVQPLSLFNIIIILYICICSIDHAIYI